MIIDFIKKIGWFHLSDSDGSCSCGTAYIGGILIKAHCHRTSLHYKNGASCTCPYAGVHVWWQMDVSKEKAEEVGKIVKDYIEEYYPAEVKLVLEGELNREPSEEM